MNRDQIVQIIECYDWNTGGSEMPLTKKGEKILKSMKKEYGKKKGERVFYASQNKGTIKGTHKKK